MSAAQTKGGAKASPTFDPAAWLAVWADHGGIAMNTQEHLYLGRSPAIDREASEILNRLRVAMLQPEAASALRAYLHRRQCGEVQ